MEPPKGILASLWNFIRFLPYFTGLLLLGIIKGIVFCPLVCLIVTIGNSAIILGLWPVHSLWTYYCVVRAKQLGPGLKIVLCICVLPVLLVLWPVAGIIGSIVGGAAYGFLSPIFATFDAVGEGKTNEFFHCLYDGTWSTVKGSFTIVRDLRDVCFHSYFSVMDDLLQKGPPDVKYYEIRLLYLPGAIVAGIFGIMVDMLVISVIALCKSPYMLFKGWHRLFHDLIGREGPFLETICVPFAGLAILLWPLAVVGSVMGSFVASIFLGAYAGVVVYEESSFLLGLQYIVAALSIYDEYSNDILDMPEGSCFPRPHYRKAELSLTTTHAASFSRPSSFRDPLIRTASLKNTIIELTPLELLDSLFMECQSLGETMVAEGLITREDIEAAKSSKGSRVISIGLPAYCILQTLLRSAKANSVGILLSDNFTEMNATNRPKGAFFDWFLNPLLIIKDQIKAENLSVAEEDYLRKLVLLSGDPERFKSTYIGPLPESERKRAELDALARRLQGITKSISRYPTYRRRFESLFKRISNDLAEKNGGINSTDEPQTISRSKSAFARILSLKSFKGKSTSNGSVRDTKPDVIDVEISS
ncbi:Steroid nuclear receptor, ligand-binding [Quillaja saponaria]|uniref:Steroid nuclear receptor, ligand-binding n=1 Tax=Quillaja saponaria TaxID=32244 RepID=A0AAD7Q4H1_QUISA|nr:Steroid nuclear receptor, ligand-binding [Quillaja saponaria]